MIYNEKLPTAVVWWKKHFHFPWTLPLISLCSTLLILSVAFLFTVCPCARVCVCLRTAAVKLQGAGNFSGPHEELIRLSLSFRPAGLSAATVCSLSFKESRSDRWSHECAVDFPLNLSLISGQECYDPLTKLSILPFVWTRLPPWWL